MAPLREAVAETLSPSEPEQGGHQDGPTLPESSFFCSLFPAIWKQTSDLCTTPCFQKGS